MDSRTVDALARTLAAGLSRRRTIGVLSGIVTTALLANSRPALAGCKKVGKKCDKNKDCCDGARCKGDTKKKKGKCRCKSGRADCDGDSKCENLNTDENNCGACGVVCVSPQACCDGVCSTACAM